MILRDSGIPTQKDIATLNAKIDRLEKMVKNISARQNIAVAKAGRPQTKGKRHGSATDMVFASITRSKKGDGFTNIQKKTGFDEKKIRNIIFRLHKLGKIKRVGRGKYVAK
ncbi:hypothetical protein Dole_2714 [Desulfosudis oleivorans Hxd3]|uniref:Replication protein A C-terminal domain-containing protein n=1 Tax=Desulfosudis oleivorans (strain DSM 6200 / JCM 39069 / Hxd3) TaxID=96561 RepID=A8ZXD8_DESOH|nr:hypothetical protein Dole_2714 [Desulfosudis oleivorans Hxd3]